MTSCFAAFSRIAVWPGACTSQIAHHRARRAPCDSSSNEQVSEFKMTVKAVSVQVTNWRAALALTFGAPLIAISTLALGGIALAQSGPPVPPSAPLTDENHVDFVSGGTSFPIKLLSIGSGDLGLSLTITYTDQGGNSAGHGVVGRSSNLAAYVAGNTAGGGGLHYHIGFKQELIGANSGGFSDGGSVDANGVYTNRNGVKMHVSNMVGTSVSYPNGKLLTYRNGIGSYPALGAWSVLQNNGLLLKRSLSNTYTIINLAYEYCDPDPAVSCVLTQSWPSATESYILNPAGLNVTDSSGGGTYQFRTNGFAITSYHDKGWAPGTLATYQRCTRSPINCYWASSDGSIGGGSFQPMYDRVTSATRNGITWSFNYVWNVGPHGYIYQSTSPMSRNLYAWSDPNMPPYTQRFEDGTGKSWRFDFAGRVTRTDWSDGLGETYSYDARGNLFQTQEIPKPNSGIQGGTTVMNFDSTCAASAKCNKPNYLIDANGNRTDFTYDQSSGLPLTESLPAVNGIRPVKRYSHVQRNAWYLNSSGSYVKDPNSIWLLASEKTCQTSATVGDACAVTGDEIVSTYDYGPDSGPNNLWLRGIAVTAGGVTRRTCYSYDRLGNKISETSPRAGLTVCP